MDTSKWTNLNVPKSLDIPARLKRLAAAIERETGRPDVKGYEALDMALRAAERRLKLPAAKGGAA